MKFSVTAAIKFLFLLVWVGFVSFAGSFELLFLCREKPCAGGIEAHFPSDYRDQEFRRGAVCVSSHIVITLPFPAYPLELIFPMLYMKTLRPKDVG